MEKHSVSRVSDLFARLHYARLHYSTQHYTYNDNYKNMTQHYATLIAIHHNYNYDDNDNHNYT